MKIILYTLLLAVTFAFQATPQKQVYVCESPNAVAYHQARSCRGLQRCKHTIVKVTEDVAKSKYGLRRCKICY